MKKLIKIDVVTTDEQKRMNGNITVIDFYINPNSIDYITSNKEMKYPGKYKTINGQLVTEVEPTYQLHYFACINKNILEITENSFNQLKAY